MLNPTTRILTAIPSTEPCTFNELLRALGDEGPPEGMPYRQFFLMLEALEEQELVTIDRFAEGAKGRIETLQLTDLGAERAREALRGE